MADLEVFGAQGREAQRARRARSAVESGTYSNVGEKIDWTYWDTTIISNTVTSVRLFTNPLGGSGARTLADTNIIRQSIPRGQKFIVRAIKIFYYGHAIFTAAALQAFFELIRRTALDIKIVGKDSIGQWGLDELIGAPILGANTDAVTVNTSALSIGRFTGIFPLNSPIKLAELTDYEILLQHFTAPAVILNNDVLKVALNGTLYRLS